MKGVSSNVAAPVAVKGVTSSVAAPGSKMSSKINILNEKI